MGIILIDKNQKDKIQIEKNRIGIVWIDKLRIYLVQSNDDNCNIGKLRGE